MASAFSNGKRKKSLKTTWPLFLIPWMIGAGLFGSVLYRILTVFLGKRVQDLPLNEFGFALVAALFTALLFPLLWKYCRTRIKLLKAITAIAFSLILGRAVTELIEYCFFRFSSWAFAEFLPSTAARYATHSYYAFYFFKVFFWIIALALALIPAGWLTDLQTIALRERKE